MNKQTTIEGPQRFFLIKFQIYYINQLALFVASSLVVVARVGPRHRTPEIMNHNVLIIVFILLYSILIKNKLCTI